MRTYRNVVFDTTGQTMEEIQCDSPQALQTLSVHESEPDIHKTDQIFCQNVEKIIDSKVFQLLIMALVTVDMIIVTIELTCSLDAVVQKDDQKRFEFINKLQICNLVVVSLFILEITTKIFVYRRRFWKCYELFDTAVILISFVLDVLHIVLKTPTTAAEFIIAARFWRIARIVNGTVYQIRSAKGEKLSRLLKENEAMKEEIKSLRLLLGNPSHK